MFLSLIVGILLGITGISVFFKFKKGGLESSPKR